MQTTAYAIYGCNELKVLLIFFFSITITSSLAAQDLPPIQLDRPDQTESPYIVPARHFQIESGISFEKFNEQNKSYTYPTVLFKYGVNDAFELRLIPEYITSYVQAEKFSGITPLTVGFKVKLAGEKGVFPMVSFIGHLGIPSIASKKFKTEWYAPSFRFTMQHTLSNNLSLGYNLGAEWDGESPTPAFIYTLTTGYSISEKLGAFLELYGFLIQKSTGDHRINAGLTYLIKNNMAADISGGIGINKYAPAFFIAAGYSIRLKNYRKLGSKKNPALSRENFRVDDGARTHDPQNHNLML